MTNALPDYDVAVVGGGVGGIYTAWRMLTADIASSPQLSAWAAARPDGRLKIAVFEGSDRIGGRLLSARPPEQPHVTVEIGGMRYVSSQILVKSLVENKLQLPRHEQIVDLPQNLAYLRGKRLHQSDLTVPDSLPYDLTTAERQAVSNPTTTSSGLIPWAITQLIPGAANLHGDELVEFLQTATVDGTPLYQQGFWNLVARALSNEGYQLSRTTVGYDGLGWNANAVDMTTEYLDFTPNVKYYMIDGGYDLVPWTLEKEFREAGGEVKLGMWLDSFDAASIDGSTGVVLRFQKGEPQTAHAVILAMPRRSIELLRPEGPVLDPARAPGFQVMLNSVEPLPLYKMFICYPFPWWETVGVTAGRSLTDIPLRQVYYWAVEGRQYGANPASTQSTILSYNDASSVEFWGGLRNLKHGFGPGDAKTTATPGGKRHVRARALPPHGGNAFAYKPSGMPQAFTAGDFGDQDARLNSGDALFFKAPRASQTITVAVNDTDARLRKNWDEHEAPAAMVDEMHRQLMQLHGLRYAPEPYAAAFMDWSDDPYGGGVHFWNPGHKSWDVLERMTQPVEDFPCYICGEAWSTNQTWVEGALQTSEIVLQRRFKLKPPGWVTEG